MSRPFAWVVVILFISPAQLLFGQEPKEPDFTTAINYMARILDMAGDEQHLLLQNEYRHDACRLYVSDSIVSLWQKPAKTYATEVQFHLAKIDPDSIKMSQTKTGYLVSFEATDYESVIFGSASKWKETHGKMRKSLELWSVPSYNFRFMSNREAVQHFQNAFVKAVNLCGGKKSSF